MPVSISKRLSSAGVWVWLTLAAAGTLGVCILMVPPAVGLADNGDFARVMGSAGLQYPDDGETYEQRYFRYAHFRFAYSDYLTGGYVSSQIVLLNAAAWLGRLLDGRFFDIRVLGSVYLALWLAALALIVRGAAAVLAGSGERVRFAAAEADRPDLPASAPSKRARAAALAVLSAALVPVFGDVGYLAYFNSFYGEPYAFVGVLMLAGASLALAGAARPSGALLALFTGALFAAATSKIQYAPLALAFLPLYARIFGLRRDFRWRVAAVAAPALVLAGAAAMVAFAPGELRHINLYQSVFYGILKDSPVLREDLRELGIPEKYAALAGTNYFQKDTAIPQDDPQLKREVLDRLGHADVALFYLRHPDRLWKKMERAAEDGVFIRPSYLGNYAREAGHPPGALAGMFSGWSRLKPKLPHELPWVAGFYAAYVAALAAFWLRVRTVRARMAAETMACVALAGMISFLVPIIGDGEADLAKHLFMFNVCSDMMVVSASAAAAWLVARLATGRRATPGG